MDFSRQSDRFEPYLLWGLVISLSMHVWLGMLFGRPATTIAPPVVTVDIVPFEEASIPRSTKQQIVSPSEQDQVKPDDEQPKTRLLSEQDNIVRHEQIKRGDDPNAGTRLEKQRRASVSKAVKQSESALERPWQESAPLKHLALDPGTLIKKFTSEDGSSSSPSNDGSQITDLSSYQAFSRPAGSGAAFIGIRGSSDFLPNLPDGDITLLNTKASKFAVFVRRVATQVFAQLRNSGWESLRYEDVRAIAGFSTVSAILSPQGELLSVSLDVQSGSGRFDDVLAAAVTHAARDPNPPAAAVAEDGNIHFIFKAKTWAARASDPRTGAPSERRWLLLATGLG